VNAAQQAWAYIVVDTVITGLVVAGLVLLGVTIGRWVIRTRRRPRS